MKKSESELLDDVYKFNVDFPVGSKVRLRMDSGEVDTCVAAPAILLGGHSPVAFFDGVRGAYSIVGRVSRVPECV